MDIQSNVKLGTGSVMPSMGFGTWRLNGDVADIVGWAITTGYSMVDTSGDYGSQPGIGQAIKNADKNRNELCIITKVEETDDTYRATLKNLDELQLDYIDLMLIHRPPKRGVGEDLWRGLIKARQEGLVRDIGVSNYTEQQIQTLADITGVMPVVNQIEWTPFGWSKEMKEFCKENRIVIQAYSPLTRAKRLDDGALQGIGMKYNKSPAQILVRWCLQQGIVPLPKASTKQHIEENIDVFDFELGAGDMELLNELNERYSALGHTLAY